MTDIEIHGFVAPGLEAVRDAFAANWTLHGEAGASLAASVGGEMVVDLWAGSATFDDGEHDWAEDTIINVWSTTKTMSFLCCLLLADRGHLDLYEPISSFWPEFAANGKERIATRHVLSHSAGLPGWDEPLTMEDFLDHDKLVRLHAAQAPWWEPGTAFGYHAISQGFLLNEIVRRTDPAGRTMGRFFADEFAEPLGADFHIGTGPEHDARIARVIPPADPLTPDDLAPDSIQVRALANPVMQAEFSSTKEWRRAEIPAAGGHGNARSVARVHTATANGGEAFGRRIMTPDGVDRIFDEQQNGVDMVLQVPGRIGMGFGLKNEFMPLPNDRCCFWGGWGGSLAIIDTENHISYSYVMNKMNETTTGDPRGAGPLLALYLALAS